MRRRALLLAGPGTALAAPPAPAPAALWQARFARPEGGELALAEERGRWLLINFWATWCAPCVHELPDLQAFWSAQRARGAAGWRVIGLAIDAPTPVRQFLQRFRPALDFPLGLAGLQGADLGRSLGNLDGRLPFTVLLRPDGALVWRRRGATHLAELSRLAQQMG